DPVQFQRAQHLAKRTYELVSFLVDVRGMERVDARYDSRATYHDSCAGLRELGVKRQPRRLLASVTCLDIEQVPRAEICCRFRGTFCIKSPEISDKMVAEKTADIAATGADTLLAGDLGCLLNMAGKLHRQGSTVFVRHVAEVLADMAAELPPIGAPAASKR